jgi:hypothetical protein
MKSQEEVLNDLLDEIKGLRRDLGRFMSVLYPKKFPVVKKPSFGGAAVMSVNYQTGKITSSPIRPMAVSKDAPA